MLLQIDANEHSGNISVRLCVSGDFTDGECPFHFAAKRANVLSSLCDLVHLSYGYTYG